METLSGQPALPTQPPNEGAKLLVLDLTERLAWQRKAACKDIEDPDIFFTSEHESAQEKARREIAAKVICSTCLVKNECLNYALRNSIREGIWGQRTAEQLKYLRRIS